MFSHYTKSLLIAALLLCPSLAQAQESGFEWSGFGRVVAGYLAEDGMIYGGYDDELSLKPNSLLGLQGEWQFDSKLSLVGQAVLTASDQRDSDIEWLYLNYRLNDHWQVKFGQLNTPFFSYSDVQDVGYAYHWVQLPIEAYPEFLFKKYRGASIRFTPAFERVALDVETYYGSMNDTASVRGNQVDIDLSQIYGVIAKLSYDKYRLSASYHKGEFSYDVPRLNEVRTILTAVGFNTLANQFMSDGTGEYYQLGLSYDDLNVFARSEITYIAQTTNTIADYLSYYLIAGYVFDPVSVYVSFAERTSEEYSIINTVPKGVTPQLDELSIGVDALIDSFAINNRSLSIGARFDSNNNVAFKVEVKKIRGNDFQFDSPLVTKGSAVLLLTSVEWVF
ncbi:porin [Rheinheimera sp. UJ63]|uniref:porin n=1 Tax=Rheinheimera sp. UJ63 TaxID=2910157 RepID=UPI001F37025F|nr:porin [Rheinheimera sp. UJ63]MCF4008827.1 porin [Rheinheimera sp. UJ63]